MRQPVNQIRSEMKFARQKAVESVQIGLGTGGQIGQENLY